MLLHTILIDDDPATLDTLELELHHYCPDTISIIQKCTHAAKGLEAIRQLKPDLVIIDVEMPKHTGIQVVEILRGEGQFDFDVIFTTAYEEFSIKAFELNAVHYLLKPYCAKQLVEAVNRAKIKRTAPKIGVTIEQVEALITQSRKPKTMRISTREGIEFLLIDTILFVEADGGYSIFHLCNNERRIVSNSLKTMEQQLSEISTIFKRTHQSYLINSDFIRGFKPDGSILLRGYDAAIPVGRSFKTHLNL